MIDQIRTLQVASPFEPFAIELANGRVIQIYEPWGVATREGSGSPRNREGQLGIFSDDSFEVINAAKVVSVSVGVHPIEAERFKKLREHFK
jgi:hypothetical protein